MLIVLSGITEQLRLFCFRHLFDTRADLCCSRLPFAISLVFMPDWRLLNLDTRRFVDFGEFEGGSITGLHDLLVTKPPQQLETLAVMRQRSSQHAEKLQSRKNWREWRPTWYHHWSGENRPDYPFFLPEKNAQAGCALIDKLPSELLCYVADILLGPRSTPISHGMALAMTCQAIYEVVRPRLNKKLTQSPKNWAGDRIICVSYEGVQGDLPPDVFTEAEIIEYHQSEDSRNSVQETEDENPINLYYAPDTAEGWIDADSKADNWNDAVVVPRGAVPYDPPFARYHSTDEALVHLFERTAFTPLVPSKIADICSITEPSSIQVLRSLTKREYIRRDVIESKAQEPRYVDDLIFKTMARKLGEVAFHVMQWSLGQAYSWDDAPDEFKDVLHRGRWAGHRLDLAYIQEDVFDEELKGWIDVTNLLSDIAFGTMLYQGGGLNADDGDESLYIKHLYSTTLRG